MLTLLKIISIPLVPIYCLIVYLRNLLFDINWFKSKEVNAVVISVGNISVGGSGKTPAVLYIAGLLKHMGKKVGILSRGYQRDTRGYLLVSDGSELKCSVQECGDEIYLTAKELQVPAAVAERRVEGAKRLIADTKVEYIVLDDAFQHRWINRDLDIVMIDQRFLLKEKSLDKLLLPSGVLRESFSALNRADAVIINSKFSNKELIPPKYEAYLNNLSLFRGKYECTGIHDVKTGNVYSLKEFKGQKSLVVCGIARPFSFLQLLEQNGIDFTNKLLFPDHKEYAMHEIQKIRKKFYDTNAYSVLTTQKDAVKLANYSVELDDIDIYYAKIDLVIENNDEFLQLINKKIKNN